MQGLSFNKCFCRNKVHYRLKKSYCKTYYQENKDDIRSYQRKKTKEYQSWKKDCKEIITDNIFKEYFDKLKRSKK